MSVLNEGNLSGNYVKFVTGLTTSSGSDNTATINAAITAVNSAGGGGVVMLPKGIFPFTGTIYVRNGILLRGSGNGGSGSYGGTELSATSTSASIIVTGNSPGQYGDGGGIEDIEINGNNIANYPLVINEAVDRTFKNIDIHNALLDNITINYAQNSVFLTVTSNYSGRDGLVIDNSAGGLLFSRFNVSSAGQYAVRVQQTSVASGGAYPYPTHIVFDTCVFERPVADYSLINIQNAAFTHFRQCMFSPSGGNQTSASPIVVIGFGPHINFDECYWAGTNVTNQAAIKSSSTSNRIIINGENKMVNLAYFFDLSAGSVNMAGAVDLGSGTFTSPATPIAGDNNIFRNSNASLFFGRPDVSKNVLIGAVNGETGQRFRMYADGSIGYGDGTGYSFPTKILRRSDGKIGVIGGLAPGINGADIYSSIRYATSSRTSGNVSITSSNFVAFDTAMNITLTANVNDVLEVRLITQGDNTAGATTASIDFQVYILNNGSVVRGINSSSLSAVISSWTCRAGDYNAGGGDADTRLTSSDIYNGTVTIQLMVRGGGTTRVLYANSSSPTTLSAKSITAS